MRTSTHDQQLDALLVAALVAEALPLLLRMDERRWLSRRLVVGTLGGARVAVLRCGVGRQRALHATRDALLQCPARRVVSLGTCGTLVDTLSIGDVVSGLHILDSPEGSVAPLGAFAKPVLIATVPRVVNSPSLRAAWAERGAEVCEMEADGVREAAGNRAFHAIKVVSDRAGAGSTRPRAMPRWLAITIFQQRALRLVERKLTPGLVRWLEAL